MGSQGIKHLTKAKWPLLNKLWICNNLLIYAIIKLAMMVTPISMKEIGKLNCYGLTVMNNRISNIFINPYTYTHYLL